jgi:hypothetical protein
VVLNKRSFNQFVSSQAEAKVIASAFTVELAITRLVACEMLWAGPKGFLIQFVFLKKLCF